MEENMYVCNSKRVEEFLQVELKDSNDLYKSTEQKVKDFLEKYAKYFHSYKPEDIRAFFNLTGLYLAHIYQPKNSEICSEQVVLTANGTFIEDILEKEDNVFNNHILIYTEVEDMEILGNIAIINGVEVPLQNLYEQAKEKKKTFYDYQFETMGVVSKRRLWEMDCYVPEKKITAMTMDLFQNVICLTEENELYFNEKRYAKNVKKIVELSAKNIYFIYEDNTVEQYSSAAQIGLNRVQSYDKVLYGNEYIVALDQDRVLFTFRPIIGTRLKEDEVFEMELNGVDDISIEKVEIEKDEYIDKIVLEKNGGKIDIPILGIFQLS